MIDRTNMTVTKISESVSSIVDNPFFIAASFLSAIFLLLLEIKKYRTPNLKTTTDSSIQKAIRQTENWKGFVAALSCLPIGILGGLTLDHFFPHNPASIIFIIFCGGFSAFLFVLNWNRDHET